MKLINLLLATAILTVLSGCNGGDDNNQSSSVSIPAEKEIIIKTPSQAIKKMESKGMLPKLDHSMDIKGTDTDNDGVRDDINHYIETLNLQPTKKKPVSYLAKNIQLALSVDPSDKNAASKISYEISKSIVCIVKTIDDPQKRKLLVSQLQNYTANTLERASAYQAYNQARNGTVNRLPNPNEVNCETLDNE